MKTPLGHFNGFFQNFSCRIPTSMAAFADLPEVSQAVISRLYSLLSASRLAIIIIIIIRIMKFERHNLLNDMHIWFLPWFLQSHLITRKSPLLESHLIRKSPYTKSPYTKSPYYYKVTFIRKSPYYKVTLLQSHLIN